MGNTSQQTPGSLNAEAMIENRPDGPTQRTSRSRTIWTILAVIEVLLAATAVILDLLIPTIVILVLATISLAIRRTGPASLGFHRMPRPGQMIISVFMLAIAWTVIQFSLTLPNGRMDERARQTSSKLTVPVAVDAALGAAAVATSAAVWVVPQQRPQQPAASRICTGGQHFESANRDT
jgi:hypothetical protein